MLYVCTNVSSDTRLKPEREKLRLPGRRCTFRMHEISFQAFFRRCLKRKQQTFRCEGSRQCEKDMGKSQLANCGFCRYKKCMELGMSRGGESITNFNLSERNRSKQTQSDPSSSFLSSSVSTSSASDSFRAATASH